MHPPITASFIIVPALGPDAPSSFSRRDTICLAQRKLNKQYIILGQAQHAIHRNFLPANDEQSRGEKMGQIEIVPLILTNTSR
jgi:hypothetical protein